MKRERDIFKVSEIIYKISDRISGKQKDKCFCIRGHIVSNRLFLEKLKGTQNFYVNKSKSKVLKEKNYKLKKLQYKLFKF